MNAIEFVATVRNGMIEVPKKYQARIADQVRVIVLTPKRYRQQSDHACTHHHFADFLDHPITIADFIMPSRAERHERTSVH